MSVKNVAKPFGGKGCRLKSMALPPPPPTYRHWGLTAGAGRRSDTYRLSSSSDSFGLSPARAAAGSRPVARRLRRGLFSALLVLPLLFGFAAGAQAQTVPTLPSVSPTEIYEGETLDFTLFVTDTFGLNYDQSRAYGRVSPAGDGTATEGSSNDWHLVNSEGDRLMELGNSTAPISDAIRVGGDTYREIDFSLRASADNLTEGDETIRLYGYSYSSPDFYVTITLKDGSRPVTSSDGVSLSSSAITLTELGSSTDAEKTYTVVLDTDPGANVVVTVTSGDTTAVVVDTDGSMAGNQSTLTFTPSDYSQAQTVTLRALNDGDAAPETVTISHVAAVSSDSNNPYDQIPIDDVTVTTVDAGHGVVVSKATLSVAENSETAIYTVVLKSQPGGPVVIEPRSDATAYATVSGALTFTTSNWDTAQTVTVTGAGAGSATITHAVTTAATGYPTSEMIASVAVTVTEVVQVSWSQTDDSALPVSPLIVEGDSYTIKVSLPSAASANVTIPLGILPLLNAQAADYTIPTSVTIQSGQSSATFDVMALGDDLLEDNSLVNVTLCPTADCPSGYTSGETPPTIGVIIRDPTVVVDASSIAAFPSRSDIKVLEEGDSDTFTVALEKDPMVDATVTVKAVEGHRLLTVIISETESEYIEVDTNPSTAGFQDELTFTGGNSGNWAVPQTVRIHALYDGDANDGRLLTDHGRYSIGFINSAASGPYKAQVNTDDGVINLAVSDAGNAVVVSPDAVSVVAGSTVEYDVHLASDPGGTVVVTPTSGDTTVASVSGALTFTSSDWSTAQTVTVTGAAAGSATISHAVTTGTTAYPTSTPTVSVTATVTAAPNSAPTVDNAIPDQAATVDTAFSHTFPDNTFSDTDGDSLTYTATEPDDSALPTWLTFNANTRTFSGTPAAADVGTLSVKVTADDGKSGTVSDTFDIVVSHPARNLDIQVTDAYEGENIVLTLTLSRAPGNVSAAQRTFSVDTQVPSGGSVTRCIAEYGCEGGSTPVAAADFTATSTTVVFSASETVKTVAIPTATDSVSEGVEVVAININYLPGTDDLGIFTSDSTQFTGRNGFDIGPILSPGNLLVSSYGHIRDGARPVPITITEAGGTTVSEDGSTTTDTYTVVLDSAPSADVTVTATAGAGAQVQGPGGTAGATATLTFTPGGATIWSTAQTITVTGVDDAIDNAGNARTVTIAHAASSTDATYTITDAGSVSVTVTDDDTAGLVFTPDPVSVAEGGSGSYTVALASQPSANVTVTISGQGSTDLMVDTDSVMAGDQATLTFTPGNWNGAQSVSIEAGQDGDGANDSITLAHAPSGGGYGNAQDKNLEVTITDDDFAGGVTLSQSALTLTELGSSTDVEKTYTVVLDTDPGADVVVTVSSGDPTAVAVDTNGGMAGNQSTLTFTPGNSGNWNTAQTVTLRAVNDGDTAAESVKISHTATVADTTNPYHQISISDVTATTVDAGHGVVVSKANASVRATNRTTYTIVLKSQPGGTVTVTPTSSATTTATVSGALSFNDSNWDTAQTVTVTGAGAGSATISHAVTTGTTDYPTTTTIDPVTVTVTERYPLTPDPVVYEGQEIQFTIAGFDAGSLYADGEGTATNWTDFCLRKLSGDPCTPVGNRDNGGRSIRLFGNPKTFRVEALTDSAMEGEETVIFNLYNNNYKSRRLHTFTITIKEGTPPPSDGVSVSPTDLSVTELHPTDAEETYTVKLNTDPRVAVTITAMVPADDTEHVNIKAGSGSFGGSATLTFTPDPGGNWNIPQTVTVHAVNDPNIQGQSGISITHTAVAASDTYNQIHVDPVLVDVREAGKGVLVSETQLDVLEGETATYKIALKSQPGENSFRSSNVVVSATPSMSSYATVSPGTLTFNASTWNVAQTVTVMGRQAGVSTVSHQTVNADTADPNYHNTMVSIPSLTVTVAAPLGVAVTESDGATAVGEDGTADTYTLVLNSEPTHDVTLTVEAGAGLLVDGPDAGTTATARETLSFTPSTWSQAQTVTVSAAADSTDDPAPPRTATLSHTSSSTDPTYNGIAINDVSVAITDDDPTAVTLSTPDTTATEGDASATAEIRLSLGRGLVDGEALVVPLRFSGGTPGAQFTLACPSPLPTGVSCQNLAAANPQVTFTGPSSGVGATSVTLTLTASEDDNDENETVTVSIPAASSGGAPILTATGLDGGATGSRTGNGEIVLTDDDEAGVTVTEEGGATAVGEDGTTDTVTLVLDTEPTHDVTVTVNAGAGLQVGGAARETLTFTPSDWRDAQTLTVSAAPDSTDDPGGIRTASLTHTAASTDSDYNGIDIADVSATITDDDATAVVLTTPDATAEEENASDTAEIRLSLGRGLVNGEALVVPLQFSGGTPGTEFSLACPDPLPTGVTCQNLAAANPQVTFTGPNSGTSATSVTLTLAASGDDDDDDVTVTVSIPSSSTGVGSLTATGLPGGATGTRTGNGQIEITDNDSPGVMLSTNAVTVGENGGTGRYTVVLNTPPAGDVEVRVTSGAPSVATVNRQGGTAGATQTLTFTTANWKTAQSITVTGVDDNIVNHGGRSVTLTHAITSGDGGDYPTSLNIDNVTVTLTDDEDPTPVISVLLSVSGVNPNASGQVPYAENAGPASFTVRAAPSPAAALTVCVRVSESGAVDRVASSAEGVKTVTLAGSTSASVSASHSVAWTDTDADDRDSVVTVQAVASSVAGCASTDTYRVHASEGSAAALVRDDEATAVSLASSDMRMTEGDATATATATVSLGRRLYAGEVIAVPVELASGTGARLPGAANHDFTVSTSGREVSGTGLASATPTITFTGHNTHTVQTATITFTPVANRDDGDSLDERITATLASDLGTGTTVGGGAQRHASNHVARLVLEDDDKPAAALVFTPASVTVNEGGSGEYTVELAAQPTANVTVTVSGQASSDLSVDTDSDSGGAQATLTFTPDDWDTAQTVDISASGDDDGDNDSVTLAHSAAGGGYGSVSGSVTVTITDNDPKALVFSPSALTVAEGGTGNYTVKLSTQPSAAVTVTVSAPPGSDLVADTDAGTDGAQGTLTFTGSNWNATQPVSLMAGTDGDAANDSDALAHSASGGGYGSVSGSVSVTVTDAGHGVLVSKSSITVKEGDGTASYTIRLKSQPGGTVTITPSSGTPTRATVSGAVSFNDTDWDTAKTVTVTGKQVGSATISHALTGATTNYPSTIAIADVSVTVAPAAGVTLTPSGAGTAVVEGGATDSYTVVLDAEPTHAVTVTVTAGTGLLVAGSASRTLTFTTSNWSQARSVTVSAAADSTDNPGAARTVNITHTAASADGNYNTISIDTMPVAITDDDPTRVTLSTPDTTATEGDAAATARIALTLGRGLVDGEALGVPLQFAGGAPGTAFTLTCPSPLPTGVTCQGLGSTPQVTFTGPSSGASARSVTLTLTASEDDDGDNETVTVSIPSSSSGGGATLAATQLDGGASGSRTGNGQITLTDNDIPGVTISKSAVTVGEGGGTDTYTVRLATQPAARVDIRVTSGAPGIATVNRAGGTAGATQTLTYTTSTWNTMQTLTVTGVNDETVNSGGQRTATLAHAITRGDGGDYPTTRSIDAVTATVTDDDTAALSLSPSAVSVDEGGTGRYTVALAKQPFAAVTVTVSGQAGTDLTVDTNAGSQGAQASLNFTTSNWSQAQTVELTAARDGDAANDAIPLAHSASGGGYGSASGTVSVTITDAGHGALLSRSALSVAQNDEQADYTIRLTSRPGGTVVITPTSGAPARATVSGAVSFNDTDWSTPKTVTVTGKQTGSVTIRHAVTTATTNYPSSTVIPSVSVTVTADTRPVVTITPDGATVAEGEDDPRTGGTQQRPVRFTIAGPSSLTSNLSVAYTVSQEGSFLTSLPGSPRVTLSAPPRHTMNTGVGILVNDATDEPNGSLTATLSEGADYRVGTPRTATVTLVDNDPTSVTLGGGGTVAEDGSDSADVTVTLGRRLVAGESVTVPLSISGANVMPSDYRIALKPGNTLNTGVTLDTSSPHSAAAPALRFTGHATNTVRVATLEVTAQADLEDEGSSETLAVGFDSVNRAVTSNLDRASGTGTGGTTPGGTARVTITDDDAPPGLVFSPPSVTIAEGDSGHYTVGLSTEPSASVAVTLSGQSGSDLSIDADTGTPGSQTILTFAPANWRQVQTVSLSTVHDDDWYDDTITLAHAASGGNYAAVTATVTVTIDDDERPPVIPEVSFSTAESSVAETIETHLIEVTLSEAAPAPIELGYRVGGTATPGEDEDYSIGGTAETLTVETGASSATFTVSVRNDERAEPDETVILTLQSGDAYALGDRRFHTLTIRGNDHAPKAEPSEAEMSPGEAYVFRVEDFQYEDEDNDRLLSVQIVTLPDPGELTLGTVAVEAGDQASREEIEAGALVYTPPASGGVRSSFRFRVNDGMLSENAATFLLNIAGSAHQETVRGWLARFGRTIADQVIEAVEDRLRGSPPQAGDAAQLHLAGREWRSLTSPGGSPEDPEAASLPPSSEPGEGGPARREAEPSGFSSLSGLDWVGGTSFNYSRSTGTGLTSVWGRGAVSQFDGIEAENHLDGRVESLLLGADFVRQGQALGLLLSHSRGKGGWQGPEGGESFEAQLTGLHQYARYEMNERWSLWSVAGYGKGHMKRIDDSKTLRGDLDSWLLAGGVRGQVRPDAGPWPALSAVADLLWLDSQADGEAGFSSVDADVSRLRVGLEGVWASLPIGDGQFSPRLRISLRHDGGDAEQGFGTELRAGADWVDAGLGLTAQVQAHALLTHEADGAREKGISGSVAWDPRPASLRGAEFSLSARAGVEPDSEGLLAGETFGLRPAGEAVQSWQATLGYGVGAFGDRFTAIPQARLAWSMDAWDAGLGWRLAAEEFELLLEAQVHAAPDGDAGFGLDLKLQGRW